MRLSQILVLPSFQGKGLGSYLLEVVNKVAIEEKVYDLRVKEPSKKLQVIRTCIDINRLRAFDPIKPAIESTIQALAKATLWKKMPRFKPPLNAIENVRETLKISKKQFLKCWEILIYLALEPIDKYMEDYTSVITNQVDENNKPDQEQQLKQLVEERIRDIKLVAEKVSSICPKV